MVESVNLDEFKSNDDWGQRKMIFRLGRQFMGLGGDVEDYRPVVHVLFERLTAADVDMTENTL
jgi:hypothetical protein